MKISLTPKINHLNLNNLEKHNNKYRKYNLNKHSKYVLILRNNSSMRPYLNFQTQTPSSIALRIYSKPIKRTKRYLNSIIQFRNKSLREYALIFSQLKITFKTLLGLFSVLFQYYLRKQTRRPNLKIYLDTHRPKTF